MNVNTKKILMQALVAVVAVKVVEAGARFIAGQQVPVVSKVAAYFA